MNLQYNHNISLALHISSLNENGSTVRMFKCSRSFRGKWIRNATDILVYSEQFIVEVSISCFKDIDKVSYLMKFTLEKITSLCHERLVSISSTRHMLVSLIGKFSKDSLPGVDGLLCGFHYNPAG